jgi:hypothetical protein
MHEKEVDVVQEFDIKRGHFKNIDGNKLRDIMCEVFGNVREVDDANYKLVASYGALAQLTVWIKDKSTLCVDTKMDRNVDEETTKNTINKYNEFMFKATGLTSKERRRRLEKKAKEGKL